MRQEQRVSCLIQEAEFFAEFDEQKAKRPAVQRNYFGAAKHSDQTKFWNPQDYEEESKQPVMINTGNITQKKKFRQPEELKRDSFQDQLSQFKERARRQKEAALER